MPKRHFLIFSLGLITLLTLSACGQFAATRNWNTFAVEEEPRIDIQFKIPPEWYVDYAPTIGAPGQWDVVLVPPKCAPDQAEEFSDNCINLTIVLKDVADFDPQAFINFASEDIILNQSGTEKTIFLGQETVEVNDLEAEQYNHLFFIGEDEVRMSFLFFETENAYYTFITELPYQEKEGEVAQQFDLLINSIEFSS